jgi:hypothetical protein
MRPLRSTSRPPNFDIFPKNLSKFDQNWGIDLEKDQNWGELHQISTNSWGYRLGKR